MTLERTHERERSEGVLGTCSVHRRNLLRTAVTVITCAFMFPVLSVRSICNPGSSLQVCAGCPCVLTLALLVGQSHMKMVTFCPWQSRASTG